MRVESIGLIVLIAYCFTVGIGLLVVEYSQDNKVIRYEIKQEIKQNTEDTEVWNELK